METGGSVINAFYGFYVGLNESAYHLRLEFAVGAGTVLFCACSVGGWPGTAAWLTELWAELEAGGSVIDTFYSFYV